MFSDLLSEIIGLFLTQSQASGNRCQGRQLFPHNIHVHTYGVEYMCICEQIVSHHVPCKKKDGPSTREHKS